MAWICRKDFLKGKSRVCPSNKNTIGAMAGRSFMKSFAADSRLADRGDDSAHIVRQAREQRILAATPPGNNRRGPRAYDRCLYTIRQCILASYIVGVRLPLCEKNLIISRFASDSVHNSVYQNNLTTSPRDGYEGWLGCRTEKMVRDGALPH